MSNVAKWDPLTEMNALQKKFFGDEVLSPFQGSNLSTTDVYTKDDALVVEAHLPNFEQKDIDIQVEDNALVVNAERHEKAEDKKKHYVVRESSSSFYRRIALPKRTNADKIEAHLEDGVLRVKVPLEPLPEPKKIAVKARSR